MQQNNSLKSSAFIFIQCSFEKLSIFIMTIWLMVVKKTKSYQFPTKVGRIDQELLGLSQAAQYSITFSTSTPNKREIEIKRI